MNLRSVFRLAVRLPALLILALVAGCMAGGGTPTPTRSPLPAMTSAAVTVTRPAVSPTATAFTPAPSETSIIFPTATARSITPEPTGQDLTACLPPGIDRPADGDYAPVAWIIDGASFVIDRGMNPGEGLRQTVRLIGVDPPPIAKARLDALLTNQIVRLIADPAAPDVDSTGRLLRYVLTLDGIFVNDLLVRSGAARFDSNAADSPDLACAAQLTAAETAAQEARLGLWGVVAAQQAPTPTALSVTATLPATATLQSSPSASITAGPSPTSGPSVTPGATGVAAAGTATATPSGSGSSDQAVQIINIYVIGTAPNEPDEYIELKNTGASAFNLTGWSLYSDETFAEVYFPQFSLGAGQTCRVYTNLVRADSCAGISFASEEEAWPNEAGCGGLYDVDEFPVADFCYPTLE